MLDSIADWAAALEGAEAAYFRPWGLGPEAHLRFFASATVPIEPSMKRRPHTLSAFIETKRAASRCFLSAAAAARPGAAGRGRRCPHNLVPAVPPLSTIRHAGAEHHLSGGGSPRRTAVLRAFLGYKANRRFCLCDLKCSGFITIVMFADRPAPKPGFPHSNKKDPSLGGRAGAASQCSHFLRSPITRPAAVRF